MPIGKDSIKTRVAKVAPVEEEAAKVETPAKKPAAKTATKKAAAPKAAPKAEGTAPAKKPAAKKPAAKATAPKVEAPVVDTAVLANVSPETVAAVIGHDEKKPSDKVKIGQKMPTYLR